MVPVMSAAALDMPTSVIFTEFSADSLALKKTETYIKLGFHY